MNSIKKNNGGFTLIELLLTIVIIGIIAAPFLNSFIQAMNINVEARRLQNATLVAQDVAEEFKASPLTELLNSYQGSGGFEEVTETEYEFTNAKGNNVKVKGYNFKNLLVNGADGEDFYVSVKLDPSAVVDASGKTVNGGLLPMFSNLYGGNTLIMFKPYVEPDATVNKTQYDKICNINILCTQNSDVYTYTVTMEICYKNKSDNTISSPIVAAPIEKKYSADEKHTLYLLAPIFDVYSDVPIPGMTDYSSTDVINIKYEYSGDDDLQKDFTFYLAEQAKTNLSNPEKLSRLNPNNINITVKDASGALETKNLSTYFSENNYFKINTNVGKTITNEASEGSLTYDPNNRGLSLFLMDVEVRYKDKNGKVLTTFSTTKEE